MAPHNAHSVSYQHTEEDELQCVGSTPETHQAKPHAFQLVWGNIVKLVALHIGALYGVYLLPRAQYNTWIWTVLLYYAGCMGITAGAHRLWCHRSYTAKMPLRVLLAFMQTLAIQEDIIFWVREHRTHHKFSETDADPHNAKRGFFFAHCGWTMVRRHPEVKVKGKQIDLSDVRNDPICAIQRKIYAPLSILVGFVFPTVVPWYFWSESLWNAYFISAIMRYIMSLHATWFVNSAGHLWGMKPYDKHINPVENLGVNFMTAREGFHNYHHTFPQDYSASEYGWWLNLTTLFIDFWAALGQVTNRKKMSKELVEKRRQRTGDKCNGLRYAGLF